MSDELDVVLPTDHGADHLVGRTLSLPAGTYVVNATADTVADHAQSTCAPLSDSHLVVENGHFQSEGIGMGTIAITGVYCGPAATLQMSCDATPTDDEVGSEGIIEWVTITAVKVDQVHYS